MKNGALPFGSLSGTRFLGMTSEGSAHDPGTIFALNGETLIDPRSFSGPVTTLPLLRWVQRKEYTLTALEWRMISRMGKKGVYWRVKGREGKTTASSEPFRFTIQD